MCHKPKSMKKNGVMFIGILFIFIFLIGCSNDKDNGDSEKKFIVKLVEDHAKAWETGNLELLDSILHEDAVFAYPGRRLNKTQTLEDLEYFKNNFNETRVYINKIIIDDSNVAVEWQFATTEIKTGKRQVVSDAIIGEIKDGKWIVWKEYLDGRVKLMQAEGKLAFEEGEEPFPWPKKN